MTDKKLRCIHRHTIEEHKHCFDSNGNPKPRSKSGEKRPKVLVFDIETSPLTAYIWATNVWNTNVTEKQVLSEWFMLCWSAKWLSDDKIMSDRLTGKEALQEDDGRIVKSLWNLLNQADVVIAHNGDRFDVPNMNTRFIVNGLPPTSPYQTIDTVSVSRRQFGFTHNNLNALARVLGLKVRKDEMTFEDWKKCIEGDEKYLQKMVNYNRRDVEVLEEIYYKIRPWIKSHPNLALYLESTEPICSNCGSKQVKPVDKFYYTTTGKYALYSCDCGAYIRVRTSSLSKEKRENLLVGLAK